MVVYDFKQIGYGSFVTALRCLNTQWDFGKLAPISELILETPITYKSTTTVLILLGFFKFTRNNDVWLMSYQMK